MTFIIIIALLVVGCVAYLVAGVQSNKKSLTPSNIVEEAKKEVEVVEAEIETVVETVKPKAPKKATQKKVTKSK